MRASVAEAGPRSPPPPSLARSLARSPTHTGEGGDWQFFNFLSSQSMAGKGNMDCGTEGRGGGMRVAGRTVNSVAGPSTHGVGDAETRKNLDIAGEGRDISGEGTGREWLVSNNEKLIIPNRRTLKNLIGGAPASYAGAFAQFSAPQTCDYTLQASPPLPLVHPGQD
jgi:hypothetical protein